PLRKCSVKVAYSHRGRPQPCADVSRLFHIPASNAMEIIVKKLTTCLTCAVICLMLACAAEAEGQPLRIMCLGDSITHGHGLVDEDGNPAKMELGYPRRLGELLGPQAEVAGYGVPGATYFRQGFTPIANTEFEAN